MLYGVVAVLSVGRAVIPGLRAGIAVAEQLNIGTLRFQVKATRPSKAARALIPSGLVPIEPERGGRLSGASPFGVLLSEQHFANYA